MALELKPWIGFELCPGRSTPFWPNKTHLLFQEPKYKLQVCIFVYLKDVQTRFTAHQRLNSSVVRVKEGLVRFKNLLQLLYSRTKILTIWCILVQYKHPKNYMKVHHSCLSYAANRTMYVCLCSDPWHSLWQPENAGLTSMSLADLKNGRPWISVKTVDVASFINSWTINFLRVW